ncbi:MAG: 50S ribosomal protein L22 [Candidatus Pacebacteria bacterium]|nr:50S ribosomal protein L22 [Candidatus Paceibacterota bacterium]
MEVQAHLRNLRISPRKVRLVADVIRSMNVHNAKIQLEFINKKSSQPVLKLLNSAIANAKHNFNLSEDNLYVSRIFVNEGTTLKRWIPRAMGRASSINKRTSHVTIVLDEFKDKTAKKEKRKDLTVQDVNIGKAKEEKKETIKADESQKVQASLMGKNNINKD